MEIRYISRNMGKIKEIKNVLEKNKEIKVIDIVIEIEELQTNDLENLAKDKVLKAFKSIGRPVFVEHTALYVEVLNEFPGGLTQIFWDKLKEDKFTKIIGNSKATAKSIIAYCDGKKVHTFEGEIKGKISSESRGSKEFEWDCVFIPDESDKTFAELGEKKNEISMRKKALDKFYDFLKEKNNESTRASYKK